MLRGLAGGTLLALLITSAPALAQQPPSGIDRREHRQAVRLRDAWRRGALTRAERNRLLAEQRGIRVEERAFRRNGLNRWERRDLQRDLNRASRDIYRQSHDRQRRR
jgi:hypothetical protein